MAGGHPGLWFGQKRRSEFQSAFCFEKPNYFLARIASLAALRKRNFKTRLAGTLIF